MPCSAAAPAHLCTRTVPGNASATDGIERVFDGDVVVDVYCVNLDAVLLSVAHCVVEVHAVARIVFDDEKHAFVGCALLDCVVNLNLRGGCENVAANRSVKHAFSDKTCVCGFVTATAAGDKADFCVVDVFLFDDFVFFDKFKFGVSRCKTVAHIVHETLSGVHNFLHNILLVIRKTSRQTRFRADFYKTLPWRARECRLFVKLVAAFAVAAVSEIVTDLVRCFDCGNNHVFGYGEGHVVDALVGDASLCGDDLVFFFGEFFSDDFASARICHKVVQADGETDFVAEVEHFVELFFGAVFKHELADCTECDDFAVHAACVDVVDCGQTVVDCVCSCKTAGFESETGEKDVGFNDFFESGSYYVAVASGFRFCTVADEVVIAKLCKCRSGVRAVAEESAFLAVCSAGKTCVDVGNAVDVCSCFEISGECVAHAAHEEARRCVCNDVEVDEDDGRALTEVCIIVKFMIVGVKNCGVGRRCVGCRDGGADDERIACRNALRCVDCFAAAETDGACCTCLLLQTLAMLLQPCESIRP